MTSVASSGGGRTAGGGAAGHTSSGGRGARWGTTVAQLWPPGGLLGATGASEAPWLAAPEVRAAATEVGVVATEVGTSAQEAMTCGIRRSRK